MQVQGQAGQDAPLDSYRKIDRAEPHTEHKNKDNNRDENNSNIAMVINTMQCESPTFACFAVHLWPQANQFMRQSLGCVGGLVSNSPRAQLRDPIANLSVLHTGSVSSHRPDTFVSRHIAYLTGT